PASRGADARLDVSVLLGERADGSSTCGAGSGERAPVFGEQNLARSVRVDAVRGERDQRVGREVRPWVSRGRVRCGSLECGEGCVNAELSPEERRTHRERRRRNAARVTEREPRAAREPDPDVRVFAVYARRFGEHVDERLNGRERYPLVEGDGVDARVVERREEVDVRVELGAP